MPSAAEERRRALWRDSLPLVSCLTGALVPLAAGGAALADALVKGMPLPPLDAALFGLLRASVLLLLVFFALGVAAKKWIASLAFAYGGLAGAALCALVFLAFVLTREPTGPYASSVDIVLLTLVLAPHYVLAGLLAGFAAGGAAGWLFGRFVLRAFSGQA